MRTPSVARRIAERIVAEVNQDDYYWTPDELPDRIADVAEEIVAHGNPRTRKGRTLAVESTGGRASAATAGRLPLRLPRKRSRRPWRSGGESTRDRL
jgi:hypothetical protein